MTTPWLVLTIASIAAGYVLHRASLPASTLIGPLLVAIALQMMGRSVLVPQTLSVFVRCCVGVLVASTIPLELIPTDLSYGAPYIFGVLGVVTGTTILGVWLTKSPLLPGSTAIWGVTPGAATAITLLAGGGTCDLRTVAFMQYFRVVAVGLFASALSAVFSSGGAYRLLSIQNPPLLTDVVARWAVPSATAFGLAVIAFLFVIMLRIRPAALLIASAMTLVAGFLFPTAISTPPFVLHFINGLVAWEIAGHFQKHDLRVVLKTLPMTMLSTCLVIAWAAILAYPFSMALEIDYHVGVLALVPGGFILVALAATASGAGVEIVLITQALRLLVVMIFMPTVNKLIGERLGLD